MVYIFAYRSMRQPLRRMVPLRYNQPLIAAVAAGLVMGVVPFLLPAFRRLLGLVPLSLSQWALVSGVALSLLAIVEIGKWVSNRSARPIADLP